MQIFFQCLLLFLAMLLTFITFIKIVNSFIQIDITSDLEYAVIENSNFLILLTCITWVCFLCTLQLKEINKETPHFVWNDDLESIPTDNSLITLEMTEGNIIFIGPYDSNAKKE